MSRRDREIESLAAEVESLRSRMRRDRDALNLIALNVECTSCRRLTFDLDLARELIDAYAKMYPLNAAPLTTQADSRHACAAGCAAPTPPPSRGQGCPDS